MEKLEKNRLSMENRIRIFWFILGHFSGWCIWTGLTWFKGQFTGEHKRIEVEKKEAKESRKDVRDIKEGNKWYKQLGIAAGGGLMANIFVVVILYVLRFEIIKGMLPEQVDNDELNL